MNKIKRFVITTIICVLLVTVFSSVMVYAPPPSDVVLPNIQQVLVTNTDPIPVDVTNQLDTLEVTVPDGVEVTNIPTEIDVSLDEPIEVTNPSGEALDVEVTNTEGLALNVSGWLHTTQYGSTGWQEFPPPYEPEVLLLLDTKGYRKIDIVLSQRGEGGCNVSIAWFLPGFYQAEEDLTVWWEWGSLHLSYDVMGISLMITMESGWGPTGEVEAMYYMTT